jgi:hypothetical protein
MQAPKRLSRVCPYQALILASGQPDTEEKKESSVAVARRQPLTDTRVFPQAVAHAAVAQESQELGIKDAIASSRDLAATTLATTPHQDTRPTAQVAQKEEAYEAYQAISTGLRSWFQRFANAVDDVSAGRGRRRCRFLGMAL